jgi:xanthine dehydrogenase accessory factor
MNIYRLTNDLISQGKSIVVISAVDKKGDGPVEVGKKMIVTSDNDAFGTVGGGALEYNAREYCTHIFTTKKSETKTYLLHEGKILKDTETLPMACGGIVTLYYEYIGPNEYIYIFGAGHVSKALTKTLKTMNYHVTVIDHREDVLDALEFADKKVLMPFEDFVEKETMHPDAYIVVCTPSHKYDYKVIDKIFDKKLSYKYLGMLCSKRKIIEYLKTVFKKIR